MHRLSRAGTVLLCVAGGILLASPPAVAAADTTAPTLEGITLSTNAVSVSGVDLVPVTVAVRLADDTGVVVGGQAEDAQLPNVLLEGEFDGRPRSEPVELAHTSGTPQDGVWSATVQVPSTWDGHWEISRVQAMDDAGNQLRVDPRTVGITAALDVTGTHQPAITWKFVPDLVIGDGPVTIRGRLYDSESGEGFGNQPISFVEDNLCVEGGATFNGTTAADGTFSRRYPHVIPFPHCVGIPRPSNVGISASFIVVQVGSPRIRPVISASADRASVRPNQKVTISGAVRPLSVTNEVKLQRFDTKWRTIGSGLVQSDGGFTLQDRPRTEGVTRYRVVAENDDPEQVGRSKVIEVRVTAAGEGGGGGLPITGPAALPLVGGGLLLVAVGVGLLRLGRRVSGRVGGMPGR